jgi:Predicted transcriptional regulators
MQIEYVPIDSIKPYERNTRRHAAEDVAAIKASIEAFGFIDPIGVWHNVIVEGHGRLQAAQELGMDKVPVIRLDELTDEQRRAYAIAHNKTAELSEWDHKRVAEEINSLDTDMALFGFWDKADPKAADEPDEREQHSVDKDEYESEAGVVCPRCGAWVKE